MPVIRGTSDTVQLDATRRSELLRQLQRELNNERTDDGPVLFEIPFDRSNRFDVLAVWRHFEDIRSEDRTGLILEAYQDRAELVVQALGVTYAEAIEQQLLPYAVIPMVRNNEMDRVKLQDAMAEEGAIRVDSNRLDLRFPTMAMAEAAHRRLCQKLPNGYWSISYTVAQIP